MGLRKVGSREGKSSQIAGKGKPLVVAVFHALTHCSVCKSRTTLNALTVAEIVIPHVTVKVQARYQPQDLRFQICCDKSDNGKSLSRGTFSSIGRIIREKDKGHVRIRTKQWNRNHLQELTFSYLVKEYSSLHYV